MDFKVGDFVRHILTNERCLIIKRGNEQFQVRTPDYKEIWVYVHEIEKIK